MTEDTSPENLRKFLESNDPAMVMMGLSMAKGTGIPNNLIASTAGLYMWHEDASIRRTAKSVFMKQAPENATEIMKNHWKPQYRTARLPPLKNMIEELRKEKMAGWASKVQKIADTKIKEYIEAPRQNIIGKKYQKVLDASPQNPYYKNLNLNALEILGNTIISERWNRPWYYAGVAGFIGDLDNLEVLDKLLNIIDLHKADYKFKNSVESFSDKDYELLNQTIITLGNRFHALNFKGHNWNENTLNKNFEDYAPEITAKWPAKPNYESKENKFRKEIILIYNKIKKNEKTSLTLGKETTDILNALQLSHGEDFEGMKGDERYKNLNKKLQRQAPEIPSHSKYCIAIALSKCSMTKESEKIISEIAEVIIKGQKIDGWTGAIVSKRKDFRSNYKYKLNKEHGLKCTCFVHNDYWASHYECIHIVEIVSLLEIWQGLEE